VLGISAHGPDMIGSMFRALVFFSLIASTFASETLDMLVNAAASFSAAIQQQLAAIHSDPRAGELAEKTIDYAYAKTAYFKTLRAEVSELMNIAMGREARSPELDRFSDAFSVAGENQEKAADEETLVLLKRFSRNPDIEKARAEFERAQKVEEQFHSEFDGLDFTNR
jgi:hypothetical protein